MTREDLAAKLAKTMDINKDLASEAVKNTLNIIINALAKGEPVQFRRFGSFTIAEHAERPGRIIKTGESIIIPARKAVKFKPAKELKELIANPKCKKQRK